MVLLWSHWNKALIIIEATALNIESNTVSDVIEATYSNIKVSTILGRAEAVCF